MPWAAAAEVAGYWPFGEALCRPWVACDILCSTASILNLCLVALDRHWAICSPFRYQRRMSPRLALAAIALAWALALLVSFLPVQLDWHSRPRPPPPAPGPARPPPRCHASLNRAYALASSLVSFYIPVAVMLVTYGRIYRVAQAHVRRIASLERAAEHARACRSSPPSGRAPGGASLRKEARVLRTLALVVGAFVCCWLPFFVLNCLLPFCPDGPGGARPPCVSDATFDLFVWVGWANSSLNPVIYACNADFRKAFARLLGCPRRRRCSPTPSQTANLSRQLLSYPHHQQHRDPLLPPGRPPDDHDDRGAAPPSLPAGDKSPEAPDCQLHLALDALPPFTPRGNACE
ncbi:UNVERIFIED_CONTAM: hypothetical protein K2H54_060065 [Gekko kuhli]